MTIYVKMYMILPYNLIILRRILSRDNKMKINLVVTAFVNNSLKM